jgi:phosphohistidine phosphatase
LKTLLIVRHAKSSWELGIADFDRPLNDRGKKNAPEMATRLLDKNIAIDAFVSSPAKRAKQTAELFCTTYNRNPNEIIFVESLYHAPAKDLFNAVENLDNKFSSVAIFSHNTGLTNFVNQLVENVFIDNVPTCGVFTVTIAIDKWADFYEAKKELLFFDYPKLNG